MSAPFLFGAEVEKESGRQTHKVPNINIPHTFTFFAVDICSLQTVTQKSQPRNHGIHEARKTVNLITVLYWDTKHQSIKQDVAYSSPEVEFLRVNAIPGSI